jgi:hypothetical protein
LPCPHNNQHGADLAVDANHHRAYIEDMERRGTPAQGETQMTKLVTHQSVWKPVMGGVSNDTLCGVYSKISADSADMNVGGNVTCKICLALIAGKRVSYNSKYLGKTAQQIRDEIEARAQPKANPSA